MMQKNEIVKVKIEDIGVGGEGIGKVDGYTLFIKDAIIGDVVEAKVMKAKKNYGYARLMNVLTPSKDRVEEPVCPMARKCGGCQIQEMKYLAQLAFKEAKVRGNLERIGEVPTELLDQIMHPAVGMDGEGMQPFRYRNGQRRQSDHGILCRKNTQHYREYRLRAWCGSQRRDPELYSGLHGRIQNSGIR